MPEQLSKIREEESPDPNKQKVTIQLDPFFIFSARSDNETTNAIDKIPENNNCCFVLI